MRGYRYLHGVVSLRYEPELCNGCHRCAEVCPHQVFEIRDKRAHLVARDNCMECGACALNCTAGALQVDSGVGCASGLIVEWWREVTGKESSGCCC